MIDINVARYIENEKCYDSVQNNENGVLDYLNSLTDEDIEIIKSQVEEDETLREEIDSLIGYYLYHYKTWGDK